MIFLDSSAWIEYFTGGSFARRIAPFLERPSEVVMSSLVLYEVYKKVKAAQGEEAALDCIGQMAQAEVVAVDESIALAAADISLSHQLAMADAIVYATARFHQAKVVTLDADFKNLPETIVFSGG